MKKVDRVKNEYRYLLKRITTKIGLIKPKKRRRSQYPDKVINGGYNHVMIASVLL